MIYSTVVWYDGYIFRSDQPDSIEYLSTIAELTVTELKKRQPAMAEFFSELVMFGQAAMLFDV